MPNGGEFLGCRRIIEKGKPVVYIYDHGVKFKVVEAWPVIK